MTTDDLEGDLLRNATFYLLFAYASRLTGGGMFNPTAWYDDPRKAWADAMAYRRTHTCVDIVAFDPIGIWGEVWVNGEGPRFIDFITQGGAVPLPSVPDEPLNAFPWPEEAMIEQAWERLRQRLHGEERVHDQR